VASFLDHLVDGLRLSCRENWRKQKGYRRERRSSRFRVDEKKRKKNLGQLWVAL
jgi:hypothetical protein